MYLYVHVLGVGKQSD